MACSKEGFASSSKEGTHVSPDRSSIEKKDFPLSRRGYERTAVHAHLREVAGWFDEERSKPETLATAASEQVRSIVEAAEASAAEIRRRSEVKANSAFETARRDAERVRVEAARQAEEYVGKVRTAAAGMLDQVREIQEELGSLIGSVRSNSERLGGELEELTRELGRLSEVSAEWSTQETEAEGSTDEEIDNVYEIGDGLAARASGSHPEEVAQPVETSPEEGGDQESEEEQRARLVALDMALGGKPREDADRFLAATYRLENRQTLLDEIYDRVSQGGR
jgi:hypothetical protein